MTGPTKCVYTSDMVRLPLLYLVRTSIAYRYVILLIALGNSTAGFRSTFPQFSFDHSRQPFGMPWKTLRIHQNLPYSASGTGNISANAIMALLQQGVIIHSSSAGMKYSLSFGETVRVLSLLMGQRLSALALV
jgi:hypothetical protein